MPATDTYVRDLKKVHVVFALSCAALFVTTIWMMAADHKEEWTDHQRTWERIQETTIKRAESRIKDNPEYDSQSEKLATELKSAEDALKAKHTEQNNLAAELQKAEMAFDLAGRKVREYRAYRDKARADYDLDVRDAKPNEVLAAGRKRFDDAQATVDKLELELQAKEAARNTAKQKFDDLTKSRDEIQAGLKKLNSDFTRLDAAYQKLEPDSWFSRGKRRFMEWPIINGFNSHLKIVQDWIPNGRIKLGMATTARFDRCRTCHLAIDRIETGNVPAFPFGHPEGESIADWVREKKFPQPYSTHPNPDLYLTAASPHPVGKFGCTLCHDGQGSGTSFTNASHTPNDPHIDHEWHKEYGYHSNHFWEYPMLPKRFAESSCIKCHHQVSELKTHPKFGATAPTVARGRDLIQKYGCFGCHEIHGFDGGKPIGPDLRLEPSTEEEAKKIAADPTQKAGQERKVGPALRHLKSKTTEEWVAYWTAEPKRFRPTTKMPQFFDLSNLKDDHAQKLQPIEIAAVTQYLFDKSQPLETLSPAEGYEPNAERGKELFSRRGCLACHSHEAFGGIAQDFGPDLSKVYAKVKPGPEGFRWLYTWIRDPERHHKRTKMPHLYIEPEVIGGEQTDQAADIAAFLLSHKKGPDDQYPEVPFNAEVLDELTNLYLAKALKNDARKDLLATRKYPLPKEEVKGDEIELVTAPDAGRPDDAAWRRMKLNYVGRRTISRYGCYGCHDIPGFEQARPIGTALQDWGRKDTSRLAFEHIHEFLEHHGEADGSSTKERVEEAMKHAEAGGLKAGEFSSVEQEESEMRAAFFTESLLHHGRPGFLWQKLRDPRSYDYHKTETKAYDERLRMPKFPLKEDEIEAISVFVLGLIAEPPAPELLYRPEGAAKARIEGDRLIEKFNCSGCHMLEMPEIHYATDLDELAATELAPADHPDGLKLLMKLKPPVNGVTRETKVVTVGEEKKTLPVVKFRGLVFGRPDPEDDPADQEFTYDLWETLDINGKHVLPATRMLVPATRLVSGASKETGYAIPARGGKFAEWLVDQLAKSDPLAQGNPQMAWQMSPPPLYREGTKVQTPWLYHFLKEPAKLRHTTVLRMPRFNMNDDEAQKLANYFAAVDEVEFPYQNIPERDPEYAVLRNDQLQPLLQGKRSGYLDESWKLLTEPSLCNKCHSVGGRDVKVSDPKKDIRGPNLEYVTDRLRPDWTLLWIYKPNWITPYTSMPVNFPKNGKTLEQLFNGDAGEQVIAVRDALMNYHRLMESELQATAKGKAPAPAKGAGGGD